MKKVFYFLLALLAIVGFSVSGFAQIKTIPTTGTTLANPLIGPIEYRGASSGIALVDTLTTPFYIGSGNLKDLVTATKSAKIGFSGNTTHPSLTLTGFSANGQSVLSLRDNLFSLGLSFASSSAEYGFTSAVGGFGIFAVDGTGSYVTRLNTTPTTIFLNSDNPSFAGATYNADYSANYIARSLVDKDYVDNHIGTSLLSSSAKYTARVNVQSVGNPNSKLQTDESWSGNGWSSLLRIDTDRVYVSNDFGMVPFKGVVYAADYSSGYTSRSLIDKGYADATYFPASSAVLNDGHIWIGNVSSAPVGNLPTLSASPGTFTLSNTGIFTFPNATTSLRGLLTSTDWNTFNGKESVLTFTTGVSRSTNTVTVDTAGLIVGKPYFNAKTGLMASTASTLAQFAATTSSQLLGVISDETGTGKLVFGSSPTFTTPLLGTPTSGVLTNCTGLPFPSGITGTYTIGDLFQASSTSAISPLAAVTAGSYLRSAGTGSLSVWSTLKLPNTGTSTYIPYYSSTNTLGETSNMLYDGNRVVYFTGVYVNQYGFSTGSGANFATASNPFFGQTSQNTRWSIVSGFNNSSGAAARTGIVLQNNASGFFIIDKLGGSFTTSGAERQNCTHIQDIDAGLSLSSSGASGKTEFYTGGAASGNLALTLSSAQLATFAGGITMTVAKPLTIPSGTNTRAGNATLVGGTVTVNNTTVTANTIVILTRKTSGGTIGTAITYTLSASTSFTINSDNPLDTSTFSYMLIENP